MDFFLNWKKKGFFTLVYVMIFFFLVFTSSGVLRRNVSEIFDTNYNKMWLYGIAFFLSGLATFLTDRYTFEKEKFVRDDYQLNETFFIPMKLAGQILIGFGLLNLIGAILES